VLEQRDGKLNTGSLAAVSAAMKLGGSVTGLVAGKGGKAVAEEAAKVKGVEKIIYIDSEAYDRVRRDAVELERRIAEPLSVPVLTPSRDFRKTSRLWLWRTRRKADTHISLLDTLPLEKI
jgi:hypothetical protein